MGVSEGVSDGEGEAVADATSDGEANSEANASTGSWADAGVGECDRSGNLGAGAAGNGARPDHARRSCAACSRSARLPKPIVSVARMRPKNVRPKTTGIKPMPSRIVPRSDADRWLVIRHCDGCPRAGAIGGLYHE